MTTMVILKFMTNKVDILDHDTLFDNFTCDLVKFEFFGNFSGVHKLTIEVIVGFDLWSFRNINLHSYSYL